MTKKSNRKRGAAIKRSHNRKQLAHHDAVDRISLLPDDILISVLSRLPLGKAMATNTISTRWRNLYTHIDRLIFIQPESDLKLPADQFSNYLNKISRALDLFSANLALKEFRVNLLRSLEGANLKRWLEFALARKVEVVNIRMMRYLYTRCHPCDLQLSNLITASDGGRSLPGFKSLKDLSLCGVQVEDREIQLLLSSFPLLESLSISGCSTLKNISVVGLDHQGLKLKHFEIAGASKLESVEVRDMTNLVSLSCIGYQQPDAVRLTSVWKLTELQIGLNAHIILPSLTSSIRDQLRLLKISMSPTEMMVPPVWYQLKNLKQLEIKGYMYTGHSNNQLQKLFLLIEQCGSLETLKVHFVWLRIKEILEIEEIHGLPARKQLSPNLKNVELSGYLGKTEEREFALLLINNAEALEEFTVKLGDQTAMVKPILTDRALNQFRSIAAAKSLNLVIL